VTRAGCQQLVFTGEGRLELREVALRPPASDEVLVRATRTMISTGTELTCLHRRFAPGSHFDQWVTYPFASGYLMAGRVEAVGTEVRDWSPGDAVSLRAAHASHAVVHPRELHRTPARVDDASAVWMGLGKIVQVGVRVATPVLGDVVAVVGLGLLGQLAVQYARLAGAGAIIAVDARPERARWAARHGATHTCATVEDSRRVLHDATAGGLADVVYDVTGNPDVLPAALSLAAHQGRVVLLGDAGDPSRQHLTSDLLTKGLRLLGAHDQLYPRFPAAGVRWSGAEMQDLFLKLLAREDVRVADLVTHVFSPEQAAEAYRAAAADPHAMGVQFEWA